MTITRSDWTAALRSGQYNQGLGHLMTKQGTYCCLGVACAVAKEGLTREETLRLGTGVGDRHISDIVPGILQTLDIDEDIINTCIEMNDTERKTFAEIADYIDALPAYYHLNTNSFLRKPT